LSNIELNLSKADEKREYTQHEDLPLKIKLIWIPAR